MGICSEPSSVHFLHESIEDKQPSDFNKISVCQRGNNLNSISWSFFALLETPQYPLAFFDLIFKEILIDLSGRPIKLSASLAAIKPAEIV